jgi:hypothetical protein
MDGNTLRIGWAQTNITPVAPALMEGQMYMRCSQYVHDPLTATALALDNGEEQAIFVSMDMTEIPTHAFERLRDELESRGILFEWVTFNVTHTHNSSSFNKDFMRVENEQVYDPEILPKFEMPENMVWGKEGQDFFVDRVCDLIFAAWEKRAPGGISYAHDYAAVAFNRRPQFDRGDRLETTMYGDCSRKDFVRFESGVDTSVELLYTWNEQQELTGVVCNVPCPSQVYELHCFLSADYWGPTRSAIREKMNKNVYVLPMCGAAGDLAPIDLTWYSKTNKKALLDWGGQTKEVLRNFDMTLICQGIGERISEAVERGYKTAKNYIDYKPAFMHKILSMELPIRQVSEEEYRDAEAEVKRIYERFSKEHPMEMADLVKAFEPQGVILRYRQQKKSPVYAFDCHILRLGNVAIATNPFELYHEFALRIKARAKAEQVFIVQLSNGAGGYLPTRVAVEGGSYSSKPASTVCGPEGGDMLVEKTLEFMDGLWDK